MRTGHDDAVLPSERRHGLVEVIWSTWSWARWSREGTICPYGSEPARRTRAVIATCGAVPAPGAPTAPGSAGCGST
jgi:hypothetical protein